MAKKAKLDILEINIDEKNEDGLHDDIILEEREDDGSNDRRDRFTILSKAKGWMRKPLFWIILISVVMVGLIAGIFIGLNKEMDRGGPVEQKKRIVSEVPVLTKETMTIFDGFVIDQKDDKGHIWIVFCDVALELDKSKTATAVDSGRIDVRNVIYTLLKQEPVKDGLSSEGKIRFKARLRNELNNLFGENLVKNIYFTRYEMN